MRIPRIYEGVSPLHTNTSITLDEYGAGHVSRVLRLKAGDKIRLFDGHGHEFMAVLEQTGKKTIAHIEEPIEQNTESPLQIELLQVVSRGDRMDFTIQKATELGVTSIVPLLSERCGVKLDEQRGSKKLESYQKIAIAACEQCGRNVVPEIKPLQSLTDYLKLHQNKLSAKTLNLVQQSAAANALDSTVSAETTASTTCALNEMIDTEGYLNLTLDPRAQYKLTSLPKTGKYRILIGPEGGFTLEEVTAAQQAAFVGITLGPRILRTETTALVALAILGSHFGDL